MLFTPFIYFQVICLKTVPTRRIVQSF